MYGTNFIEFKKENIYNNNFFFNFKKLVPYKCTLVSFIYIPKFSTHLIFSGSWMVKKNVGKVRIG